MTIDVTHERLLAHSRRESAVPEEESELHTRTRIVKNAFREQNNCLVLLMDTRVDEEKGVNPFGFHFEFDRSKYEANKKRRRRKAFTRWLAIASLLHSKLGARHLLLVLIMALYAVLGGAVFQAVVNRTVNDMNEVIDEFVSLLSNLTVCSELNVAIRSEIFYIESKHFYKKMLVTEGRYADSAWYKSEDLEQNIQWTFLPAMFYAFTLFSTIGYGTIACHTWTGRYISIVYSCIGIPLMLLTIGDLGEVLQRRLCGLMTRMQSRWSCWRKERSFFDIVDNFNSEGSEEVEEEEEELALPLWMTVAFLLAYLCIASVVIYLLDQMGAQDTDFTLAASFYFVFISISTTGFGDVMPNSAQFNPLTLLAFLFGLVIISIMNTSMYSHLYDFFYTRSLAIERKLDAIHATSYEPRGHRMFKKMCPAFTTLSLSFPSSAFSTTLPIQHLVPEKKISGSSSNFPIVADPLLKRKQGLGLLQPLGSQERSHSINFAKKIDASEPRLSRAMSVESSQRSPGFLCAPVAIGTFKYKSSMGSATLGTLGGIDIAVANRRREMARIRKESERLNDRPY